MSKPFPAVLEKNLHLLDDADEAVKAIVPPFGDDVGLSDDERSDLLTALCIIGEHRNRCYFALKRMLEEEEGGDA